MLYAGMKWNLLESYHVVIFIILPVCVRGWNKITVAQRAGSLLYRDVIGRDYFAHCFHKRFLVLPSFKNCLEFA